MEKDRLPDIMKQYLAGRGIDASGLLACERGDFDGEMNYNDVYVAFDREKLYILTGRREVLKKRFRRPRYGFGVAAFREIAVETVAALEVQRNMGTARLVLTGEGEPETLAVFSLGLAQYFEQFCAFFGFLKEGKPEKIAEETPLPVYTCPRCGHRYPDQTRDVCPYCLKSSGILRRLFGMCKDYLGSIIAIIIGVLGTSALSIVLPYITVTLFYDEVLTVAGRFFGNVIMVVGMVVTVRLLDMLFNILYSSLAAKISARVVYDLKMRVFSAMQRLGISFFTNKQTGTLMTRVTEDANRVYWFLIDCIPYVTMSVFMVCGVTGFLYAIHPVIGLIMTLAIPVIVVTMRLFYGLEIKMHRRNYVFYSLESSYVNDSINGQRVIKAYARESTEEKRFADYDRRTTAQEEKVKNYEFYEYPIMAIIFKICQTLAIIVGCALLLDGRLTLGVALSISSYTMILMNPLDFLSFVPLYTSWAADSASRIFEICEARSDCPPPENPVYPERFDGEIRLENVSFNYELQRPIFRSLSLTVQPGEMLGIAGKSGAGKTTLINLMSRLFDVRSGAIYIDGVNVKDIAPEVLRKNIGIVSQEIYLFIGTIADNIRYAKPEASVEEVITAAKAANAHDFIMRLPDAYETIVGEGGQDLSGGERQRVSIARAVLQNPKILILDEATAAMDTRTERNIQLSLDRLQAGRTTISIAHRLSTLRGADKLAVIEKGELVEYGTHSELINKKGVYFGLYQIQTEALKFMNIGDSE